MAGSFHERGYAVIEGLLDPSQVRMAAMAMELSHQKGAFAPGSGVPLAEDEYGPILGEIYLRHCKAAVEAVVGSKLIETYAYWRIYHHGSQLDAHTDRESCEVTVSVTIDSKPDGASWPFGLCDLTGETAHVALDPGSAIIVQGHRITHWRDKLTGESHRQLFLHYVHADGPFADHAFDKRSADPLGRRPAG